MLRLLVLLLVLANAAYWAWSNGMLAELGLNPSTQTEPQRMATQINPEAIRLLTQEEAARIENGRPSAAASGADAGECLLAGPFNEQQSASLRAALEAASLPAGSWQMEATLESARWIVYMGKYPSEEAVAKKRGELRQLGVAFRPVTNAALAPGLSLGSFASQAEAETELVRMAGKGVRTARVVQERAELRGQTLKLTAVDSSLRARLDALAMPMDGKTLRPCP